MKDFRSPDVEVRIASVIYLERISNANLLNTSLEDLHLFPWSDEIAYSQVQLVL